MQPPTVDQAHEQLVGALQDMQSWEARAKTAKELLNDMLKSRREAAELATKFDIRWACFLYKLVLALVTTFIWQPWSALVCTCTIMQQ